MKRLLIMLASCLSLNAFSQTNIFPASGNVGIGTTSPSSKLHVENIADMQHGFRVIKTTKTSDYWAGVFQNTASLTEADFAGKTYSAIFSGGNVGIGTTTPNYLLHINGSATDARLQLTNSSTGINYTDGSHIAANGFDFVLTNREAGNLIFETSDIERIRILSNGNVGIGTTNPESRLEVKGGGSGSLMFDPDRVNIHSNNNDYELSISGGSVYNNGGRIRLGGDSRGDADKSVVQFFQGSTEVMRINNGGNIGVGTTTPNEKLHIESSINGELNIQVKNTYGTGNRIYLTSLPGIGKIQTDGDFAVATNGGGWSDKLIIKNTGNVGIGITNPQYKLAVEGTIGAREVKVTAEAWSDFVFHPTYKLRTLDEVEQFIKTNNHLPEIPTEADVKQNGVGLGEMNAKLLQKIEELTLYMIEMKKENEDLKNRVSKLENNN